MGKKVLKGLKMLQFFACLPWKTIRIHRLFNWEIEIIQHTMQWHLFIRQNGFEHSFNPRSTEMCRQCKSAAVVYVGKKFGTSRVNMEKQGKGWI